MFGGKIINIEINKIEIRIGSCSIYHHLLYLHLIGHW